MVESRIPPQDSTKESYTNRGGILATRVHEFEASFVHDIEGFRYQNDHPPLQTLLKYLVSHLPFLLEMGEVVSAQQQIVSYFEAEFEKQK